MYTLVILFVLVLLVVWQVWHRRRTGNPVRNDWNWRFLLKGLLVVGVVLLLIWLVPGEWSLLILVLFVGLALVEGAGKRSKLFNRGERGESGREQRF